MLGILLLLVFFKKHSRHPQNTADARLVHTDVCSNGAVLQSGSGVGSTVFTDCMGKHRRSLHYAKNDP